MCSAAQGPDVEVSEQQGYRKDLGNRQVQMVAIGGAIGSGIFLGSGGRLQSAGPSLMIGYAVAGLFAYLIVRALGEMAVYRPSSGSFVSYSREFLGEKAAYFAGWMYFLNWATTGMADITAVALYSGFFFPHIPQWIPALIALIVVLVVNLLAVKIFGELEFWFAVIKVLALLIFMGIAICLIATGTEVAPGITPGPQIIFEHSGMFPFGFLATLMILQGVVFAYSGVEMIGVTAGECADPKKIIPKAVNSVGWRIALFYVGSILLLTMLLPASMFKSGESPFVTVLDKLGVSGGASIMTIVVITAALSSLNSGLYTTGRILRSLAFSGSAPGLLQTMSKHGVPCAGVMLTAVIYLGGVILNALLPKKAFDVTVELASVGVVGMWSMIVVAHWAFWRKSKDGELERPTFRLPGAPYTNAATLVFLLLVLVMTWFNGQTGQFVVMCIPAIGVFLVIGWLVAHRHSRAPS